MLSSPAVVSGVFEAQAVFWISHALRRAEDLPSYVAAAIEAEAGCC